MNARKIPLALGFLAATALIAAAPSKEKPGPERFEATSDVFAVEVPVNVVDRDGQPVRGLKATDFEIWDEGERQTIAGFEVVDLDISAPAGSPAPAAPTLRNEPVQSTSRRHFMLLFDLSFSTPTAVLKARMAARDFVLNTLRPTDLAAVSTFSLENGPKLVVTFTPDRSQLARAIDTLGVRQPNQPGERLDPLRFVIDPPLSDTGGGSDGEGGEEGGPRSARANAESEMLEALRVISGELEKSQKSYDRARISAFSRSLGDFAKSLSTVPGRKQLVLFSEGFDSQLLVGRELNGNNGNEIAEENRAIQQNQSWKVDNDNRYGNSELQKSVHNMLEQFRRADLVIQAVDIGGLRALGGVNEAQGSRRQNGQDALFILANGTGGELFKDTNNLGNQLERVLRRSSVTYLLTFQRQEIKRDGAYHRLKVKASLPSGARLSHRTGYYAPRPFPELHPFEKNLLASDGIASAVPRRELSLKLLTAPFRATEKRAYVPVIIEVSGPSLLVGQKSEKLNVEFYTYVSDDKGEMQDYFTQVVGLDLGKMRTAITETGVKYYGHLDLAPGSYRVRVLVRNAETGRTGVESAALTVPPYASINPVLLPPFFVEAPGRWVLVREKQGGGSQASVVYPFTVKGEPYIPSAFPSLTGEETARVCLVAYNLGSGDLEVTGQVLGGDGQPLPGGELALVERTTTGLEGVDKLVATFAPTGLKAGDYVLQVAVIDPATKARNVNSMPFTVR